MGQTSSAVRATKKFPGSGIDLTEKCTKCGEAFGRHDGQRCPTLPLKGPVSVAVHEVCGHPWADHKPGSTPEAVTCPALPPSKAKQGLDAEAQADAAGRRLNGAGFKRAAKEARDVDSSTVCHHCGCDVEIGTELTRAALLPKGAFCVGCCVRLRANPREFDRHGTTSFTQQLEDATGVTAANEKTAAAAEHFEREVSTGATETIEVKHIRPSPRNPRTSLGDLSELAASLSSLKVMLQPIIVREVDEGRGYEIVSGHRRFAAAVDIGWEEVPCLVHELSDVQALEVNLTEQINRKDLTPLEEGEACRSLMEMSGYDTKQVAAKLGQSTSWVTKRLSLCTLAPELKKKLGKSEINVTLATALAALPNQKMQLEAVEKLEDEADSNYGAAITTEEQLETLRTEFCRPLKGAPWKLVDADLVPEAGACSTCPKNSANNQAPGLFDNVKAPPTCSNLPCWDAKAAALWARATAKFKEAGAKILPHGESTTKLFYNQGGDVGLNHGSRYVEAKSIVQEDGGKRSWATLIEKLPAEERPQLHIAQDPKGGIHELYVQDKATEAIAEHLELKWAKKAAALNEPVSAKPKKKAAAEIADQSEIVEAVTQEIIAAATKVLTKGADLTATRLLAEDTDDALGGSQLSDEFFAATGIKGGKDWVKKGGSLTELLAFTWFLVMRQRFGGREELEDDLVALAKFYGLDARAMVKAKIAAEKAEADAKKKAKGGKS